MSRSSSVIDVEDTIKTKANEENSDISSTSSVQSQTYEDHGSQTNAADVTPPSRLTFFTDQLKTVSGILLAFEIVLGVIIVSLTAYYTPNVEGFFATSEQTYLFIVSFTFLVVSFLLFIASLIDISCGDVYNKSIFVPLYLSLAFILYISASVALLVYVIVYVKHAKLQGSDGLLAAAILGLINSVSYLFSLALSVRVYIKSLNTVLS